MPLTWQNSLKTELSDLELTINPDISEFPTLILKFQRLKKVIFTNCKKIAYFSQDTNFDLTKETESKFRMINLKWAKFRTIVMKEKDDIIVITFTSFFGHKLQFGITIVQPEEAILELER